MTAGTIGRILSAGYSCVTWSLTEEPVMDVIEWTAEQVPGGRGQLADSLPAPEGAFDRPGEGLAGLGDRELLAIAGSLPAGSGRAAVARELLVSRYGHLVRSCARRYSRSPESAEDLIQVGYVGLLKAIGNFDLAGAGGLAAFARPYVSGEIKRHFRDKRWPVHVPRLVQELILEIRADAGPLAQDLGRVPAEAELARHLGVTGDALREARKAELAFQPGSLNAPLRGEPGTGTVTLADLLGGEDPHFEHVLGMRAVVTHWGELPPREQKILILRFYRDMTQAQIGQQLGISQMHVSRLTAHALGHLRTRLLGQQDHPADAARPGNRPRTRSRRA
jgi:RNA polymerase sigma-B factor